MADDVLYLFENDAELQLIEKRYHIHPQKTVVVRNNVSKGRFNQEIISEWKLGSTSVNVNSETIHLGPTRAEKAENHKYF